MENNNQIDWRPGKGNIVTYPCGAVSTGPQHLTLDDEPKIQTTTEKAIEWAKAQKLEVTPAEALVRWAFESQKEKQ